MSGGGSIGQMIARLRRVSSAAFREELSKKLAEEALRQVDAGFREARDPYGKPWAPTKQPNPILQRSGAFRSDWSIAGYTKDGFRIISAVEYGGYHQHGTKSIAIRMVIPTAKRGLGLWRAPFEKIVVDHFRATMTSQRAA